MDVAGKTILVTGGTDGIGLELARQLLDKRAKVIVCGRRADMLDSAVRQGLEAIQADLSSAAGCAKLIADLGKVPIDILINNAGAGNKFDANGVMDTASIDATIFLNLNAPIHLIAKLLPSLKARPEAMIVNVTSGLAIAPNSGSPVYCATKAALRSFTMSLRSQLKGLNVHVVEALPPVVETDMTKDIADKGKMKPAECARQIVAAIEGEQERSQYWHGEDLARRLQRVPRPRPQDHDPILTRNTRLDRLGWCAEKLARPERFERPTPKFVVWCSIQLSYGRAVQVAG